MSKRFIVGVDSSTEEQDKAFLSFVKSHGLGWWHWLENFWLITDSSDQLTASDIRDELGKTYPGVHKLVIELSDSGDTWSGYGPKSEKRNMFNWLNETWGKYK